MRRSVNIVARLDFAAATVLGVVCLVLLTVPALVEGDVRLGVLSALFLLPLVIAFVLAGYLLRRGVRGGWWYQLLPVVTLVLNLGVTELAWRVRHVAEASTTSPDGKYVIASYVGANEGDPPDFTVLTVRPALTILRSLDEDKIFSGYCQGELGFRWVKTTKLLVSCERFERVTARNIGPIYVQYVPSALFEFENISAPRLLEKIEELGALEVLRFVFLEETIAWAPIRYHIARGEELWLRAGGLLFEESDAHQTAELMFAISSAMLHAPDRVLALPGKKLTLREKCGDGGDEIGAIHAPAFYQKAIQAVSRVSAPNLSALRDECIKIMERFAKP